MPFLREYLNVRRERKQGVTPKPVAPLKLRPGAYIRLNETPFLLLSDDARAAFPGQELIVTDVCKTSIGGVPVTRAHARRVGTTADDILLQIAEDGDQVLPMIFTRFDTIVPGTDAEWANWLAEDGILGSSTFMIPADENPAEHPATIYRRAIEPDIEKWVSPESFSESVGTGRRTVQSMLYYRTLGEPAALPYIQAAADNLTTAVSLLNDPAMMDSLGRVADSLHASVVELTPKPEDAMQEYLLIEFSQDSQREEIVLWIGIETSPMHFQTI